FCRMNPITTLIFDLGGVIINLKTEDEWLHQDLLPHFQPDSLLQLQQAGYFRNLETGNVRPEDFLLQMQAIATDKHATEKQVKQHWNAILQDIPSHRVELLQQLKQRYRLVLLSNTNSIHVESFQRYMHRAFGEDILRANFHTVYYSQEIGLRKPTKETYEFVMQQQQLQPAEILFLDDKSENLREPHNIGWQTFHVNFNELSAAALQHLL
ncbi:MAG: HAD-IA family hydrolase, partial [Chitinophagales bacterium]